MDLLPYAFNSLTGEVGKLAVTFGQGLPLRELITELDEHFGIIADLDMLRREFYSMKQGMHETVSQFAGRVGYQLMKLQTMFPGAIPQCDEEEIKKGRLYGGLKLHLKSAMTFCREMANKGKDLNYHQLLKIARCTETDYEDKDPSRCQEDRGKVHHSSSKSRKDFGSKPAGRYRSPLRSLLSLKNLLTNSLHQLRKKVRRRLMKLASSKQDCHLRRNMVVASGVEKKDTLQEIAWKTKRKLLRRI